MLLILLLNPHVIGIFHFCEKSEMLHLGIKNPTFTYNVGLSTISSVDQREIRLLVTENLSFNSHSEQVAARANSSHKIFCSSTTKGGGVLLQTYKSCVKPLHEHHYMNQPIQM